jgi:uncharacterized phage protein (TIGR01671 family)
MRDIKFRAWDEEIEEMIYSDKFDDYHAFSFNDNGRLVCYSWTDPLPSPDPLEPPQPESYEIKNIMQYIGKMDKNGKEIYVGDIVQAEGVSTVYEVRYSEEDSGWYPFVSLRISGYTSMVFEIIGNIHENPELLEK